MIQTVMDCLIVPGRLILRMIRLLFANLTWLRINYKNGMSNSFTCLNGKTAIVTGGNSGLGYMNSLMLASRGCKVIIACRRNAAKEINEIIKTTDNPNITFKHLDLSKFSSVRQFAESIKKEETKIDILINNAGIGFSQNCLTEDGLDMVMQSNYFGHFLLTHLLIDLMKRSDDARIVFLSSGIVSEHNISVKNLYPVLPATYDSRMMSYFNSKACNVLMAQELSKKLSEYGFKVNAADPGVAVTPIFDVLKGPEKDKLVIRSFTNCTNFLFATDVFKAAQTSFHLATSKEIESGHNYFRCTRLPQLRGLNDQHLCDEVWKESEKIVKLSPEERL